MTTVERDKNVKSDGEWLLTMLQMSDSIFPIGTYTMSYGLEAFFQERRLHNRTDLKELIENYITFQLGPADCVAAAHCYRACLQNDVKRIVEIDDRLYAMKMVEGFREGSTKSGGNLLRIANEFLSGKTLRTYMMKVRERGTPGNMAVCWGVVTNAAKIPLSNSLMMMLYTFSAGILGAATRLGIVDHITVQKTLHSLRPTIINTVKESLEKQIEDMNAFVPTIDVMGMRHKRLSIRMFIN